MTEEVMAEKILKRRRWQREYVRRDRSLHPEKHREIARKFRGRHHEKLAEKQRKWRLENHNKAVAANTRWRVKDSIHTWAIASLLTHKRKGCLILISTKQLEEIVRKAPFCAYCGERLVFKEGRRKDTSATVDRINNETVLGRSNIRLLCWLCNISKAHRTHEQLLAWCGEIVAKFGG